MEPHIKVETHLNQALLQLLLLADPSPVLIDQYFTAGTCYSLSLNGELLGVLVLCPVDEQVIEIKNIAITLSEQGKGYGTRLLGFAEAKSKALGYHRLRIGTGNSSLGQLALYQRLGFEVQGIKKNFFVDHYKEPIIENDISCKHLILLEKLL